jgi:hypothetical protein
VGDGFSVTASNTLWIFVACSHEPRHLHDIVFAVDCLRSRGVGDADVLAFVDHPTPEQYLAPYGIKSIFSLGELTPALVAARAREHVFVTVGGHGHVTGVGSGSAALTPTALLKAIRSGAGTSHVTLLVTQCYGGIFNLLDATIKPELVTIGATNLNPSLSMTAVLKRPLEQADRTEGISSWSANVFALQFFRWLRQPTDVDGDGEMTLVDAYKHAGASTNELLRSAKAALFLDVNRRGEQLARAQKDQQSPVVLAAIERQLKDALDNLHLHQEPWLLHAALARKIRF